MSEHEIFRNSRRSAGAALGAWTTALVTLVVFGVLAVWLATTSFIVHVDSDEVAIRIRLTGKELTNDMEVAPDETHKGVQREVLGPGRYFLNPFVWTWKKNKMVEVPAGKIGVVICKVGEEPEYGVEGGALNYVAKIGADGMPTTKGIVPTTLKPGRYPEYSNDFVYHVEIHDPVVIPQGHRGIVTNLTGPMPAKENSLLSEPGERGTQRASLEPQTVTLNPYLYRVEIVNCQDQRFTLAESEDMGFPSKDGFWVSLDGVIVYRIKPERAAEVMVIYNERENGNELDDEIRRMIILPNARSFCRLEGSNSLGREFIEGGSRSKFEEKFERSMRAACEPLGIEIVRALITRVKPPEPIAKPVQDREIAKQKAQEFVQKTLQQKAEQKVAIQTEMAKQNQALVQAEQEVVKLTLEAEQEQSVKVTEAEQELAVAQLKLDAAKDQAEATRIRGEGAAKKVEQKNAAESAGWKRSVEAFGGNGRLYAQYVLYNKLASAYREIMVNTADSPIMKVFESFHHPAPPVPAYTAPPTTASGAAMP